MDTALRVAVGIIGALVIVIGLMFLVHPEWMGAQFYITPIGSQGLATIRADFTAFFLAAGIFALWGAYTRRAEPLKVPLLLLGVALFGRFVSLVFDGVGPVAFPPMIAEAVMIGILLAASRAFASPPRG